MKQQTLKFRQRINDYGSYHYWGDIDGQWIEPNKEYGYIKNSEQFTGVLDKEGNEIYTNDVLKNSKNIDGIVAFDNGSFVIKSDICSSEGEGSPFFSNVKYITQELKIVGSITDSLYLKRPGKTKKKDIKIYY